MANAAVAKKIRIGEVLVEEGIVTAETMAAVLAEQKGSGKRLGEMLVEQGLVTTEKLLDVLGHRLGVRHCILRRGLTDAALLGSIGQEEARRLKAIPMFKVHDTMTVAMAEPQLLPSVDRLRQLTGCSIRPVLATEVNILEQIDRLTSAESDMDALIAAISTGDVEVLEDADDETAMTDLAEVNEASPVVNLINMVILKAIREGASDIHIEPDRHATRMRYRLDGVLRDLPAPPAGMHPAIVSRIKVIGRMDIAEKRLPQEGRVRIGADGREVDLRVSSMPTLLGEKLVMRILDKGNLKTNLDDLGFRPETLAAFLRILRQPYGLVLVTGPTGSGKTTTLYSALQLIRNPELNILTVEDPVEYQLDMINQIQVQDSIGMSFARALRSILRQDPDVIMIGEIRDEETARVAIQASLTGHLVLATLHTNDAPGVVARLVDMGVEPYLLSSALNGVLAQRLARTICPHCKSEYVPDDIFLEQAELDGLKGRTFFKGKGCSRCHKSGYKGRVGIYEVMESSNAIRRLVHKGVSPHEIRDQWSRDGGLTLRQEGLLLAEDGKTTLEEILNVTHSNSDECGQ
ncbi:MAG: Flp pilus assembly complex ATPase component TadA [Phycisphaerales bacterium]|jgi:type IV pilus assembly protein PilB|nr:Flp pilus assembly complex ATPase component TadA [Phycisphaerales bacterium]